MIESSNFKPGDPFSSKRFAIPRQLLFLKQTWAALATNELNWLMLWTHPRTICHGFGHSATANGQRFRPQHSARAQHQGNSAHLGQPRQAWHAQPTGTNMKARIWRPSWPVNYCWISILSHDDVINSNKIIGLSFKSLKSFWTPLKICMDQAIASYSLSWGHRHLFQQTANSRNLVARSLQWWEADELKRRMLSPMLPRLQKP